MNYRFLHATTFYPGLIKQFIRDHPDYYSHSYNKLLDGLIRTRFGWSDFYVRPLQEMGNPSTLVIAVDLLQEAWARENGLYNADGYSIKDILLFQILLDKPDVVLLEDLYFFDNQFRSELRERLGHIPLIIGHHSAPSDNFSMFNDLDLLLTGTAGLRDKFRDAGANAEVLHLAFDPILLTEIENPKPDLDFTFTGSLGTRNGYHSERYKLLGYLLKNTNIQVWSDTAETIPSSWVNRSKEKSIFRVNNLLQRVGVSSETRSRIPIIRRGSTWLDDPTLPSIKNLCPDRFNPPVYGLESFKILGRSRVAFNNHINIAGDDCGNMRMFEATGMGTCLLTDWKKNISTLFTPDVEVVTYRYAEEASEKAHYLLEHKDERLAIARAGQTRTLREHTYKNRALHLNDIIQSALKRV